MSIETASERTQRWNREHPLRVASSRERGRRCKERRQRESIAQWEHNGSPSVREALQDHCRGCDHMTGQTGRTNMVIWCRNKECTLWPFRNGDPGTIERGMRQRNICKRGSNNGEAGK